MQEDFIHYIWKYKKINILKLKTTNGEPISIHSVGTHNFNTGPDFFAAKLKIGSQLWAGNVEIHVRSSDWFVHNHEKDSNYDNVILHVVWEHDIDVYRNNNTIIPTLEISKYVTPEPVEAYQKLFSKTKKWINCDTTFNTIDEFILSNWLERLYFERLERKSLAIYKLLELSKNDWEAVLFKSLARNFGLKVNGDSFFSAANSFDFSIVRKQQSKLINLEALFFGQSKLLEGTIEEPYYMNLQNEYSFLKKKFNLSNEAVLPIQFFRLRPINFPTVRLSQLAMLYSKESNLFSKVIKANTLKELYAVFAVETSGFWQTHYTFKKESKFLKKKLSKAFINLLLINTIIPIKYSYNKYLGKNEEETLIRFIEQITSEKNNIITKFNTLKPISNSALQSQALIELKTEYCDKNKCLHCAVGNAVLKL